jgi:hypothetical protein
MVVAELLVDKVEVTTVEVVVDQDTLMDPLL